MRVVIQRVKKSEITINNSIKRHIARGLLVLVGIETDDTIDDANWLTAKIAQLRIFDDAHGVMNKSVRDIDGEVMVVSQFTLHASTKKGNRPSYSKAAKHDIAIPLYQTFVTTLQTNMGKNIVTGEFGADMQIELLNDGPVTIYIDSKNKE